MRISKAQLQQLIKEEFQYVLQEQEEMGPYHQPSPPSRNRAYLASRPEHIEYMSRYPVGGEVRDLRTGVVGKVVERTPGGAMVKFEDGSTGKLRNKFMEPARFDVGSPEQGRFDARQGAKAR